MLSLFPQVTPKTDVRRDRADNDRATLSVDCSKLAELCRREHAEEESQQEQSPVPTPVADEPTTQPYPSETYAKMMMKAATSASPPKPDLPQLAPRPLSLPGVRSHRSSKMETVLVLLGAIGLPSATIASIQAIGKPASAMERTMPEPTAQPDAASQRKTAHGSLSLSASPQLPEVNRWRGEPSASAAGTAKSEVPVSPRKEQRTPAAKTLFHPTPGKPTLPSIEIED